MADTTINSQIDSLRSAGADTFILAALAKFAAQGIRKATDVGWRPLFFLSNVSASVGMVINPTGPEKAVGIITANYGMDVTDPAWNDDPGMKAWRSFMVRHMPEGDQTDRAYAYAYDVSLTLVQVLKQCGNDFSRANIMRQATNLHDLELHHVAWDQAEYQSDQLSSDPADAIDALERQDVGAIWRGARGWRFSLIPLGTERNGAASQSLSVSTGGRLSARSELLSAALGQNFLGQAVVDTF